MSLLPKSRKARRRLFVVSAAAVVLGGAAVMAFFALGDTVSFFYSPAQAQAAKVPAGRTIQLGGLVRPGSVAKHPDGTVEFAVADHAAADTVVYRGDLPDLFREGQGIVAQGSFGPDRVFHASQVLAKHDANYMPREVADRLKEKGEWRPEGAGAGQGRETL